MAGNPQPYDYQEAKAAVERAAVSQREGQRLAREEFKRCADSYAAAERAYRVALAQRVLELKADGVAWTVCGDLARGERSVADLRFKRDVAAAMRESASEALRQIGFTHAADRRELEQLIQWSQRVSPDGQLPESFESRLQAA